MYVCMYVCIYIYIYIYAEAYRRGSIKRVLEYRVRAPVFYRSKQEKTVFHENLQEAHFVLTYIFRNCWKPPGIHRIM